MVHPSMGVTHARVILYSTDLKQSETCDLIVDTGSTFSWIPEDLAEKVGIWPTEIRAFRLADGRRVDRPVADAIIECEGLRVATRVVLARPGDGSLLGLHALEGLGLEVDPISRSLRRTDSFLACANA